jgi:hypothetical protein
MADGIPNAAQFGPETAGRKQIQNHSQQRGGAQEKPETQALLFCFATGRRGRKAGFGSD